MASGVTDFPSGDTLGATRDVPDMTQLLLAALLLVQFQTATTVETGAVTGRLTSGSGAPAASVRIAAMPVSDDKTAAPVLVSISQTDETGGYRLADVPPGRYYIFAGLIDYPNYYPGTTSLEKAKVITIDPGGTVADIDFSLARPAAIRVSGRITGPSSLGDLSGRAVTLSPRVPGRAVTSMTVAANADGTFVFSRVQPGNYVLSSALRGSSILDLTVFDDDLSNVELAAIDCNAGVPVRGQLVGIPSAPVERLTLTGIRFRCAPAASVASDGSFTFSNVPEDSYSVRLTPAPLGWSPTNLVVQGANVTGTEIILPATFEIAGRIAVEDGSSLPTLARGAPISIQARGPAGNEVATATVNDDGSFAFRVVKGQYRISVPAIPSNYAVKAITSSEFEDLTLQPLNVRDTGHVVEIQITLGLSESRLPSGVEVTGRVIPPAGGALPKPEGVLLLSSSGGRNAPLLTAAVDEDGSFQFRGVGPGRYDLHTYPDSPATIREINVSRIDVTGLELAMPVLFKVNGAVEWIGAGEGVVFPKNFSVQFARRSDDDGNHVSVWAALAQAGSFQVYLPEGDYRFSISGVPQGAQITSAVFGSLELLESDLQVHSTLDPMTVRVTVRQ